MLASGRVLTRDWLPETVWEYHGGVDTRTVDVHIRRLRRKLGDDPDDPRYIETLRGRGYRLRAERPPVSRPQTAPPLRSQMPPPRVLPVGRGGRRLPAAEALEQEPLRLGRPPAPRRIHPQGRSPLRPGVVDGGHERP